MVWHKCYFIIDSLFFRIEVAEDDKSSATLTEVCEKLATKLGATFMYAEEL